MPLDAADTMLTALLTMLMPLRFRHAATPCFLYFDFRRRFALPL